MYQMCYSRDTETFVLWILFLGFFLKVQQTVFVRQLFHMPGLTACVLFYFYSVLPNVHKNGWI